MSFFNSNQQHEKAQQQVEIVLRQIKYQNSAQVKRDTVQLISTIPSLQAQIGTLTYDTGKQSTLLYLSGTIPIYYKGTRYNIPMNIWIVEMYPYHPPICYVTPTQNMYIKNRHKHVDTSGRCYLPYLSEWSHQKSNLYELVNRLSAVFGEDPPVYSQAPSATTNMTPSATTTPPPPALTTSNMQPQNLAASSSIHHQQQQQQPSSGSYYGGNVVVSRGQLVQQVQYKLQGKLNPLRQEIAQKMDKEFEVQQKLQTREKALQSEEQKLKSTVQSIDKQTAELMTSDQKTQEFINSYKNKDINIDDAVQISDNASLQMLECVSEENAIDDVLYYLGEALHQKALDLDSYLKNVRELAKEQFMRKALQKKLA